MTKRSHMVYASAHGHQLHAFDNRTERALWVGQAPADRRALTRDEAFAYGREVFAYARNNPTSWRD